jgi:hypothetical protein
VCYRGVFEAQLPARKVGPFVSRRRGFGFGRRCRCSRALLVGRLARGGLEHLSKPLHTVSLW